ncbi:MAG: histidine kinase [Bacteroidota bacterium]
MSPHRKYSKPFKIAIHAVIWLLLSLLPFLLSYADSIDILRIVRLVWVPMLLYAIIFYLNYGLFIRKLLFEKKIFVYITVNILIILGFTWVNYEVREFLNMIAETRADKAVRVFPPLPKSWYIYKDFISMIIPVIISIATKTVENWTKVETEQKEREKEILNSELQHLKYQLQPHFFFNSLNTVYALIEHSPEQAQETVHNLSKLMRYLLYDTESGKATLNEEIEFMTKYINLMRLRISNKTTVITDFPPLPEKLKVTPLLFISLIENAFKHGISATVPSEISFSLSVDNKTVKFMAQNANFPKTEKDKSGSGIGLTNLRKRLELSYPEKHVFSTTTTGEQFIASLEIATD